MKTNKVDALSPVFWRRLFFGILILTSVVHLPAAPTAEGLYARFDTSKGVFYCQLEHTLVPRTVANFVGLAEGSKRFIDYSINKVTNRPFFDGVTFHRVVANFVIQGGSLNGLGNDDPGYRFKDEFHPALNHDQAGVLSMANSGTNSNGSQFFITLAPASHLNNRHSVFGRVVEGLDVVQAIGVVPVDANSRPVTPVTMHSVTIVRIGTSANAFNAVSQQPNLPDPRGIHSDVRKTDSGLLLSWPTKVNHEYRVAVSADLARWTYAGMFVGGQASVNPSLQRLFVTVYETPADP